MEGLHVTDLNYEAIPWQGELTPAVQALWDGLQEGGTPLSFFTLPQWSSFAAAHGCVHPWRLLAIRQRVYPIALFPLLRYAPWGARLVLPQCGFSVHAIDERVEELVWTGVTAWLQSDNAGVSLVDFGITASQQRAEAFARISREHSLTPILRAIEPSIDIPLPGNWDAFLSGLGQNARRKAKGLESHFLQDVPNAESVMVEDATGADEPLDELIRLYHLRWGDQVGGSPLDDRRSREFYRDALRWALTRGYASMPLLRINGRIVAVATIIHIPGHHTAYAHFIGRDPDAVPAKYSTGIIVLLNAVRWAIARGAGLMCAGHGSEGYKLEFGGQEYPRWTMVLARSPRDARLLPRLDRVLHIAERLPVHAAYHLGRLFR